MPNRDDSVHLKLFSVKMHNYTNLQESFSPETVAALCISVVYLLVRFMWLHLSAVHIGMAWAASLDLSVTSFINNST